MPLVPTDYPARLQAAGLRVTVVGGWENRGNSANHRAVVFHWTASSPNESTSSCASYCFTAADDAPHYNVLIGRDGSVWVGARNKSNSSGKISGIALNEALTGTVNWASAASRSLVDSTSANESLFAVSAQNSGVGEPWSPALIDSMATTAAVTLECLGLNTSRSVTHHAALTARKIDLTTGTGGCPDGATWNRKITDALEGTDDEMKEADFDRIVADMQRVMVDVLRKEGVSGAASAAKKLDPEEKADFQALMVDVLRKEHVSGAADD